jgi:hypothetical protein
MGTVIKKKEKTQCFESNSQFLKIPIDLALLDPNPITIVLAKIKFHTNCILPDWYRCVYIFTCL